MTTMLHIHLLGDFHLIYGDTLLTTVNTSRLQLFLAHLILHRDIPQSRHHLAFLLWPDTPETQALTNLRTLLHRLRQALPEADSFLRVEGQTMQWRSDAPFTLDVADFEQALRQPYSVTTLQKATDLYRGDLLPGCYDDWILPHRERLGQAFNQALEQLLIRLEHERNYAAAIQTAQRLLRYDPLHEATYRRLMRLHALNGDRAGVQRVYQDCLATLRRELDVTPGPATQQAYERLAHIDTSITQRHNLPVQLVPFVGREEELAQLAQLLTNPTCRLLTILGPGGIGKTRLAIRAARGQIGVFLHGIYLASLAATLSAEFLVSALADALNFSFHGPEDPKIQLLNYLREKELLLVLDNFEHLLPPAEAGKPGGAGLLIEILTNAPEVKLLVTSRERLNLAGEWLFEVEGLNAPPPIFPLAGEAGMIKLESYSAVALFLQAARRVQPGFLLTPEIQADVAQLCRLVEGMPLALELAAGWVRSLSCAEIVRELEQDLGFLATSQRHLIERHQSMQAVFDHSWRLLSTEERRVWQQLSVFQGGFRREAAEQVAGASLRLLSALGDKSLLRRDPSGRYNIHELLRQYAAARLAEEPEEQEAVQDRHSSYYVDYLWRQTEPLHGGQQNQAIAEIKPEIDNIRLAWNWAVSHGKFKEIRRAVPGCLQFYDLQGWYHELESVSQLTIEILENGRLDDVAEGYRNDVEERERGIVLGQMLTIRAAAFLRLGLYGSSKDLLQQSLALLRRPEAQAELALALFGIGSLAWLMGEYTEAQALLQEGVAINQALEDQRGVALCIGVLGFVAHFLGEYEQAAALLQQSSGLLRAVGDKHYLALYLSVLSSSMAALGDVLTAQQVLRESLAISRSLGDRWVLAFTLGQLGLVTYRIDPTAWPEAKRLYQEGLAISKNLGDRQNITAVLNYLGQLSYDLGELPEAKQYFRSALQTGLEAQAAPVALDAVVGLVALQVKEQTSAAEANFAVQKQALERLALVLHHPAGRKETKERAGNLLTELETLLPPPVSAAARARGQTRSLEATATEILAGE